jgi:predicted ABC-type transport system involved in lysophospholipase L1 biosynthesis ATPase subunit
MTSKPNPESDLIQTLGIDQSSRRRKRLKRWLVVAFLTAVAAVTAVVVWKETKASNEMTFKTQEVTRGPIVVTVTATGTLEPRNQVDVGSELSGIIQRVKVDYNSRVKVGQALAELDTSKLRAQVLQAKASLESARAKVLQAQATVKEAHNNLDRLQRVRKLSNGKVPSQNDLEAAEAALDRALANEASAKADVSQAQAALETRDTDLAKAVIRSPINGIVLERNVELPLIYRGTPARQRRARALQALEAVGLNGWETHTPGELSGGQQQRVAIARAIITDPAVLFADEPTGNLDSACSREIMELLTALNRERGITIVMVTHEPDMAAFAKRTIRFLDGAIDSEEQKGIA